MVDLIIEVLVKMFLYIETLRLAIEERSNGIAFGLQGRTSMQLRE